MKIEIIDHIDLDMTEDNGNAMICEPIAINTNDSDENNGMFLVLKSWDERYDQLTSHKDLKSLLGKKVRITIETLNPFTNEPESN